MADSKDLDAGIHTRIACIIDADTDLIVYEALCTGAEGVLNRIKLKYPGRNLKLGISRRYGTPEEATDALHKSMGRRRPEFNKDEDHRRAREAAKNRERAKLPRQKDLLKSEVVRVMKDDRAKGWTLEEFINTYRDKESTPKKLTFSTVPTDKGEKLKVESGNVPGQVKEITARTLDDWWAEAK